ncbi:hypothetical protein ACK312_11885 [Aeromonas caviae]|uniref:hypothetical protein n=1 Tax=Aeromonas sp. ASNIH3 TaxID=1636608 RepID=UPI001315154E|nr:hypothetical protein [Aeromonas sp. ASNIH3]
MSRELRVRAQLLNPETGRFIKAIDERDLSDFLALIAPSDNSQTVFIPDMTPAIIEVKNHVENLLELKEKKELSITHSVIYNLWNKAKVAKNESIKEQLNIEVIRESEKALNLIHTRIPSLEKDYLSPIGSEQDYGYDHKVDSALDCLLSEVQVFIEIVLCNIHSSAIIDPDLLREPSIEAHCQSIYDLLIKWLRHEALVRKKHGTQAINIDEASFLYQCCIENEPYFEPNALLFFLDISITPFDFIRQTILSNSYQALCDNRNDSYQARVTEWRKPDNKKIERARKIIKVMQQMVSVLSLFEAIGNGKVEYSDSANIFDELKLLINK